MLILRLIQGFALSLSVVMLTACGSSKSVRATDSKYQPAASLSWPDNIGEQQLSPTSEALLTEARAWLGVPYKYGGEDRNGVDCSGFVLRVYKDALNISLPRNSGKQKEYCTAVTKNSLMPGDLIFFASDKNHEQVSHVGIFVGENLMIHASSSKGVILSDITTPYYTRTYAGSGIVDKYHSMLGNKSQRQAKPVKPVERRKQSPEGPVIHLSQLDQLLSGTQQQNQQTRQPKQMPEEQQSQQVKQQQMTQLSRRVQQAQSTVKIEPRLNNSTEPTVEDARTSVLNTIKEKPLTEQ